MKRPYRLLSLDTSTVHTGWAVFEAGVLSEHGVIDSAKEGDKEVRFQSMCLSLWKLLNTYRPGTVVIETTAVTRNAYIQRSLTEILGIVRMWTFLHKKEFVSYVPGQWRRLVSSIQIPKNRKDLKKWSMDTVKDIYSISASDDECDAILIGQARINEINEYLKEIGSVR